MAASDESNDEPQAAELGGMPEVPPPDRTRTDGTIEDPGTLARAGTSGVIEDRKRKGNLGGT